MLLAVRYLPMPVQHEVRFKLHNLRSGRGYRVDCLSDTTCICSLHHPPLPRPPQPKGVSAS